MPRKKKVYEPTEADLAGVKRVTRSALGMAGILYDDLPDVKQELLLRLCEEAGNFRKGKKRSWANFRGIVLRHALAAIVRERTKQTARFCYSPLSVPLDMVLAQDHGFDDDEPLTLQDMLTEDELLCDGTEKSEIIGISLKIDMAEFIEALPLRLRRVCLALQEMTPFEATRLLPMEFKKMQRCMNEIRMRMTRHGLDRYPR